MNHEETRFAAKVMAAWADGKTVQARDKRMDTSWFDCSSKEEASMMWDWSEMDYRIKPDPRVMFATHYEREGNPFGGIYPTKRDAEEMLNPGGVVLQFIEVLP